MTAFGNASESIAFTTIVREVARDTRPSNDDELLLIVERKKEDIKISRKSSLLGGVFGPSRTYYMVANDNDASNVAKASLICNIAHTRKNESVDVIIRYEVSCPAGKEEAMLGAFCFSTYTAHKIKPEETLRRVIQKCVSDYARASGDAFIENYATAVEALRVAIADAVTQETYLRCRIWIALDSESLLEPFIIQPISFGIGLKNTQDRFALQLHTTLDVDENNKAKAMLKLGREFELANLLKGTIRRYVESNISLDDLYRDNFSFSAGAGITEAASEILREYGRKISFLDIKNKPIAADASELERVECFINCEIKRPQTFPFQMNSVLQMQLIDLGKYKQAQTPKLSAWVETRLSKSLESVLFRMSYLDLYSKNEEIREGVMRYLSAASGEIGYAVEHLILTPTVENFLLSDDFTIEIHSYPFSLKERKKKVTLNVLFTLNIPDILDIQKYLQPSINVRKTIEDHAVEVVRHHCRFITPDYFEQHFLLPPVDTDLLSNESVSDQSADEASYLSVQDGLSLAIKTAIEKEFSAQVKTVLISLAE